jgi:hypothetical protein
MRKSLIRGVLGIAMSLNVALLPTLAQADVLSAFKSLLADGATVSSSAPGQFSSQARNSFVGGGADIRFPTRTAPSILSITPFKFQAGCGGISTFFGGFSFISGAEIVKLIKAVAQNAVGLAVELVMTTLCGPCASVMQIMRKLALEAASGALNSCQIAKQLMTTAQNSDFLGISSGMQSISQNSCTEIGSMFGMVTDPASAQNQSGSNACNNLTQSITNSTSWLGTAMSNINKFLGNSPTGQKVLCEHMGVCNVVWTMLNQTDLADNSNIDNVRDKLLLMNLTGTSIVTASTATANASGANSATVSPSSAVKQGSMSNKNSANLPPASPAAPAAPVGPPSPLLPTGNDDPTGLFAFGGIPDPFSGAATTVAGGAVPNSVQLSTDPCMSTGGGPNCSSATPAGAVPNANTATTPGVDTANNAGATGLPPMLGNSTDGSTAGIKAVMKLLECGVPGGPNPMVTDPQAQSLINEECAPVANADGTGYTLARQPVYDCADSSDSGYVGSGDGGYNGCTQLYVVPLGVTYMGQDEGYLPYVVNLLFGGVAAVQNNTALDPNLIALIQESPVPIYQAINVSAVYPDAGYQLISSMSVVIAQMLIYQHIRDLLNVAGRYHADVNMKSADLARVSKLFGELDGAIGKDKAEIGHNFAQQQLLMGQIRQANLAIQNEVMTPELLGAHRYGTALTNSR